MQLRPYQSKGVQDVRLKLAHNRAVMRQLATGGGKTAEFSKITDLANEKQSRVWVIAPRDQLLKQASNHLHAIGVKHGQITAKRNESRAFDVHVVSLQTIQRRIKNDRIINWPDLAIFDEAHLNLDAQLRISAYFPPHVKIIGYTATPERLDGRGLSELYGDIVYGPSIRELVRQGHLCDVNYLSPHLEGLELLKKTGIDYDEMQLEDLLERRKVYGSAIAHYRQYADKKPALAFCRSIKAAKETAERFSEAGYNSEFVSGKMSYKEQHTILEALRDGKIHVLANCDLATYGVDVPRAEVAIMLRPTLSYALFMQMIGRVLRRYESPNGLYVKTEGIILDHVNNFDIHGHPLDDHDWNFTGDRKRRTKRDPEESGYKRCSECFKVYEGPVCPLCGHENETRGRPDLVEVDAELIKREPRKMADRPYSERVEYAGRVTEAREARNIEEMLTIAKELKNQPMWVYWELSRGLETVDSDLLKEIALIKKYKPGWVRMQIENVERRLGNEHKHD